MMPDSLTANHKKSEEDHRREICTTGRCMYEREFIVAAEGNVSVRLDNGNILTTPACMNKGMLKPEDLIVTDQNGLQLSGIRKASSELAMHLLIYRLRPDVNAICHAHPPTATGFATAGRALDEALLPEVIAGMGQVPLVPYGTPGTPELSAVLEPFVPHYDGLLLANHGAVTCGADLLTAFFRMETIEHSAKIVLVAHLVGEPVVLSQSQVVKLVAARVRATGQRSALPVTLDDRQTSEHHSLAQSESDPLLRPAERRPG